MKEKKEGQRKKLSRKIKAIIALAIVVAVIAFAALGMWIGFRVSHATVSVWTPDYPPATLSELKAIYDKEVLTESDYSFIYAQTGLTKIGVERAKSRSDGWGRVAAIHEDYFKKPVISHDETAPMVCADVIDYYVTGIYLETGDILVTTSDHFSGFRLGHAAVVVDADSPEPIFEATQIFAPSRYGTYDEFTNRINFMVLRVKPECFGESEGEYKNNLQRLADFVMEATPNVKYGLTTGIFTKKDSLFRTQCAHLVWYAYKHFDDASGGKYNLDLDSNGGLVVTPEEIAMSPYLELVQVFGFSPDAKPVDFGE